MTLEFFLIQNQINELFLCRVMADVNECISQTALEALNNGYTVNYIGNAVGSFDPVNMTWLRPVLWRMRLMSSLLKVSNGFMVSFTFRAGILPF